MTPRELLDAGCECHRLDYIEHDGTSAVMWIETRYVTNFSRFHPDLPCPLKQKYMIACCTHIEKGMRTCDNIIAIRVRDTGIDLHKVGSVLKPLVEPLFSSCLERIGERMSSPDRLIPESGQFEELERWSVNNFGFCRCPEHSH